MIAAVSERSIFFRALLPRTLLAATLLSMLFASAGCAWRQRVMYQPEPVKVWNGMNQRQVGDTIIQALTKRGWQVVSRTNGRITAKINRSRHEARIEVRYSRRQAKVSYLTSRELNYHVDETGQPRIHARYNKWIENIEKDLARALS